MKFRNGFVSNSSTSSFIIGLSKQNSYGYYDASDIHSLFFPDKKYDDMISFSPWSIPLYCVDSVIFKEIKRQRPIVTKKAFISALIENNYYPTGYDFSKTHIESEKFYDEFKKTHGGDLWSKQYEDTKEYREFTRIYNKEIKEENKNIRRKIMEFADKKWPHFRQFNNFVIEYGNEEGVVGLIMEANDILKNVEHITLFKH